MLLRPAIVASATLLCVLLTASPGHATLAITRFVATNGSGNTCSADAPCADLRTALNASGAGDTIVCLSAPAPVNLFITKSITIDCASEHAPFAGGGSNALPDGTTLRIHISIPVGSGDPARTVRLRGLIVDASPVDRGIDIDSATAVYIEDCVVSGATKQGIFDNRTGGQTKLFIKDTIISGNGAAGIVAASAAPNVTVLDNVTSENNAYGIAVGTGNNVVIKNSVFSGNSVVGVEGDAGSHVVVRNSTISHNNIGVQSASSVRIFNNDISFNNTAFSGSTGTMGLNTYSSNLSPGTSPSPIPNAPADIGP